MVNYCQKIFSHALNFLWHHIMAHHQILRAIAFICLFRCETTVVLVAALWSSLSLLFIYSK